jgi:bifunctional non-homologous end joining protein LigD
MIVPMLATSARAPFDHPDWSWEPKYDGFRLLARIRKPGHVELFSRNLHTFTEFYRPIVEALQTLPRPAVLDGEAIMLGPDGRPSFEAMLALMERRPVADAYLQYVVFDCLDVDGIPAYGPSTARAAAATTQSPRAPADEPRENDRCLPGLAGHRVL